MTASQPPEVDLSHPDLSRDHRSRLQEDDADYLRLRDATVRRLTRSVARLVRDLQTAPHGEYSGILSAFIERQTGILQDAYTAAAQAGAQDYYAEVSAKPGQWVKRVPVNPDRMRSALNFYAPSIAKMAHEALQAVNAAPKVDLVELITESEQTIELFSIRGLFGRGGARSSGHGGQLAGGRDVLRKGNGEFNGSTKGESKTQGHESATGGEHAAHGLGHGAKVEWGEHEAQARANFRSLFHRDLADHEVASLVGARHGDTVRITGAPGGRDKVAMVHLALEGEHGAYKAYRSIFRNVGGDPERNGPRGKVVMSNNEFHVNNTGHGVGAEVLGRQVTALSRRGVAQINTRAEGRGNINLPRHGHLGGEQTGYYAWPRLGYNGRISDISGAATSQYIKDAPEFRNAKTVRDIMKVARVVLPKDMQFEGTDGHLVTSLSGREWWRRFGSGFAAHFDLKPGSESMKILTAYLTERGITIEMADWFSAVLMSDNMPEQGHEEIEWTEEDEEAAERAWRKLYPEHPNTEAVRQEDESAESAE
jgi:hypothetical protein